MDRRYNRSRTSRDGVQNRKKREEMANRASSVKRLFFILCAFGIAFLFLVGRCVYWQYVRGDELQKKEYALQTRNRNVVTQRGTIYDANGDILAISAAMKRIILNPHEIADNDDATKKELAEYLAKSLSLKKRDVLAQVNMDSTYALVARRIRKAKAEKILDWCKEKDIEGVYATDDTKRYYPNGKLASQVLGFTGFDDQGLFGLEQSLDSELQGTSGIITSSLDAANNTLPFSEEKTFEAEEGHNLTLTIDESIQTFSEKYLKKAVKKNSCRNGGCVVVTRPKTGEILAMATYPDFNPNEPYKCPDVPGVDPKTWNASKKKCSEILMRDVWTNKCIATSYEPGSTFKAITASAVLEEGVVNENTMVSDFPVTVLDATISCWKEDGCHGTETFREGVYNSCNPVFVRSALKLGVDKFYSYVRAFGIGEKTGVELPNEGTNLMHKDPSILDMSTAAFGQRFTVTPLQMAMAYGAIANGGTLMKPMLISKITDDDGNIIKENEPTAIRKVISKETSETCASMLEGVVSKGTGKSAYVEGFRVAGKTGTSETVDTEEKNRYIASFAAFAPADDPEIVVLVVLDYPMGKAGHGGGAIAAPVAKKIIEDSLVYLEVERKD